MRSNVLIYTISIIAAIFIGWSLVNPDFGGTVEYLLMLVFFIAVAWSLLLAFVPHRRERRYIMSVFFLALVLRMLISFVVHNFLSPGYFAPDEPGTIYNGWKNAEFWMGATATHGVSGTIYTIAGIVFYAFGYKPNILFLLANFLGAMTVLNIYFITRRLFNKDSARYSAIIVAVLPSIVLWSSMPLKDVYTQFIITSVMHLTLRVKERFRLYNVAIVIGLIILIGFIRPYLMIIVIVAIVTTFVPMNPKTFLRNTLIIAIFAISFTMLFSSYTAKSSSMYGTTSEATSETTFEKLQQTRQGFYTGGSKILGHVDVANPVNALMYSPLLLAVFFLAPFPWQISGSIIHNLATIESLIWYYLLYYALKAIIRSLKEANFEIMPVLVMIGMLSIAYALAISNVGAAYRFRGQVSALLLVFTGYGLYVRKSARTKNASSLVNMKHYIASHPLPEKFHPNY